MQDILVLLGTILSGSLTRASSATALTVCLYVSASPARIRTVNPSLVKASSCCLILAAPYVRPPALLVTSVARQFRLYPSQHGKVWSTSPCTSCRCYDGEVTCDYITCPLTNCRPGEVKQGVEGECCPQCVPTGREYSNLKQIRIGSLERFIF
ncbi:extracellular matrix protein fras1 [Plakobranchus ocellatus]|uniref:Extracellular matrix protein fras1 n=1 Tax=Plakobranchus ocellatus TaxID=259542 RepID=A0AAV4CMJ7_9GAST|nr:extracellular matrix protein fras1 [Plakobranchus ocellatus]